MTELSQILKDLPSQVLNLPIEERPILYENISAILKKPEINSSIIRGICKVIGSTLIKYKDAGSQQLVRKLIIDLLHIHHDSAIEHLNSVFKVLANKELPNAPISRAAKAAAIALSWTILVIKHADHNSNVFHKEWPRLLEFQIALYQYTLFSSAQVSEKVDQLFFEIMKEEHTFQKYFTCALKKECTISLTLFLMLLVRYKEMDGRLLYFDVYKNELIDHFVNSIVISKIKPHLNHVIACRPLLHMVTENDFEAKIYPNMQKAMLRNPENILNAVGIIVTEINLEFSSYASQLGKVLIQNLYSKEETSRHESVDSLKLLSQKCSKASAIEGLIKLIFSILNGSDGKITVAEYRMNLLQKIIIGKIRVRSIWLL